MRMGRCSEGQEGPPGWCATVTASISEKVPLPPGMRLAPGTSVTVQDDGLSRATAAHQLFWKQQEAGKQKLWDSSSRLLPANTQ